jgi:outer membrane protein OmpA-like peptidoglycan-associated protein
MRYRGAAGRSLGSGLCPAVFALPWILLSLFPATAAVALDRPQGCDGLIGGFNAAIDAGQEQRAAELVDSIATDAACGRFQVPVQRRLSAFRLSAAQDLMAKGRPVADYEPLLAAAARFGVLWQAAATLAETRFVQRRFGEAAGAFDNAVEIIKNESFTPVAPRAEEIRALIDRAGQARLLAANGDAQSRPAFVPAKADHRDGRIGGFYSPSVRGIVPEVVPLPITFDFDKATLTPVGQQAALELAHAIGEQQPAKVVVVGHTDIRGGPEYNLRLSQERADAVAAFLRSNGVTLPIDASGVGAGEPLKVEDPSGLTQEDLYALDRRVEWRRD